MHQHDLDLIAEYAAGTLGDDTEARARVASCQTCAQEFEAQTSVLVELSGIEPALLTEHERARLHRDLWTELRSPADSASSGLVNPKWRSWAFGAAALIVVAVALVGVMENFGGGDAAETAGEVRALDADSRTTSGYASTDDNAAEDGEGAEEALAPDTTTTAADSSGDTPYLLIAREVRQQPKSEADMLSIDEAKSECLEESGLVEHELVTGFETLTELLVAVPIAADREVAPVSFIDPENCDVVHIEE
jgi:hypothetical protein